MSTEITHPSPIPGRNRSDVSGTIVSPKPRVSRRDESKRVPVGTGPGGLGSSRPGLYSDGVV